MDMTRVIKLSLLLGLLLLGGCFDSGPNFAPVDSAWLPQPVASTRGHVVRRGETLYAIAWRYDRDYRQLAKMNGIKPPYALRVGQRIRLRGRFKQKTVYYHKKPEKIKVLRRKHKKALSKPTAPRKTVRVSRWQWPTQGRVIKRFSLAQNQKGVDISGRLGQPIKAAASGRVAYSGHGLPGYGRLIIIKHNNVFLSAYAHNQKILVKEGQWVKAGQTIAKMGNSGAKRVMLHFEIRRAGKPINPLRYVKPIA